VPLTPESTSAARLTAAARSAGVLRPSTIRLPGLSRPAARFSRNDERVLAAHPNGNARVVLVEGPSEAPIGKEGGAMREALRAIVFCAAAVSDGAVYFDNFSVERELW